MIKLPDSKNRTTLFSLNYGLQTLSGAVGSVFAGQLPGFVGLLLGVQKHSAIAFTWRFFERTESTPVSSPQFVPATEFVD